jgi:hypothetical protein
MKLHHQVVAGAGGSITGCAYPQRMRTGMARAHSSRSSNRFAAAKD